MGLCLREEELWCQKIGARATWLCVEYFFPDTTSPGFDDPNAKGEVWAVGCIDRMECGLTKEDLDAGRPRLEALGCQITEIPYILLRDETCCE